MPPRTPARPTAVGVCGQLAHHHTAGRPPKWAPQNRPHNPVALHSYAPTQSTYLHDVSWSSSDSGVIDPPYRLWLNTIRPKIGSLLPPLRAATLYMSHPSKRGDNIDTSTPTVGLAAQSEVVPNAAR